MMAKNFLGDIREIVGATFGDETEKNKEREVRRVVCLRNGGKKGETLSQPRPEPFSLWFPLSLAKLKFLSSTFVCDSC